MWETTYFYFIKVPKITNSVQVNDWQKLLFLHQLTHNMTTDCFLNHQFSQYMTSPSSEHVVYTNYFFVLIFRTIYVHNMFWAWNCHVLNWWFKEQSVVILWVSWCKNTSVWQSFICNTFALFQLFNLEQKSSLFKKQYWQYIGFFFEIYI